MRRQQAQKQGSVEKHDVPGYHRQLRGAGVSSAYEELMTCEVRKGVWNQSVMSSVCETKKFGLLPGSNEKALKTPKQGVTWSDLPVRSTRMEDGLNEK